MELEQMKILWDEMSASIEKQKQLTDSLIIKMTQTDYKNKISKIVIPETIGSFVCIAEFIFILINFQKLNTWYLQSCGIISLVILVVLPVLSIKVINELQSVKILDSTYKEVLLEYSKSKMQFVFVQKMNFYLGAILLLTTLPVIWKLIDGKDLFIKIDLWLWYAISFPFFYGIACWVFKRYTKTIADAKNILKELEN
jgi:hypothetical protein